MKVKDLFEEELYEMANLDVLDHGIKDVIIWIGMIDGQHGPRVKISNIKNKFIPNKEYSFVLTIPELKRIGVDPAPWIVPYLSDIEDWIRLNMDVICDYENGKIQSTRDFLNRIKSL
jgi:hypothetical protein